MNQFINTLNLLHVEVYQNEISRCLPTVLFSVICCYCHFYRDWKLFCELKSDEKKIENSSGMHFFMFENFYQHWWKTKTRESCSCFEIKSQLTWIWHGFLKTKKILKKYLVFPVSKLARTWSPVCFSWLGSL